MNSCGAGGIRGSERLREREGEGRGERGKERQGMEEFDSRVFFEFLKRTCMQGIPFGADTRSSEAKGRVRVST